MAKGLFDCTGKVTMVTGGNGGLGLGLVRVEVRGGMETNYRVQGEVEDFLRAMPLLDPDQRHSVHYTATPQGCINKQQAWEVVRSLHDYLQGLGGGSSGSCESGSGSGSETSPTVAPGLVPQPMSVGIITLNRPQ